jgi:mannose PTS system EIIA component
MVGLVVVGHFHFAREMIAAAEMILGEQEQLAHVDIMPDEDMDAIRRKVAGAIKGVASGQGVLILTDMFGGTPSNISLSFLNEGNVEVVTGVNLPMLIKLATYREGRSLDQLSHFITEYGRRNIYLATDVLKSRTKE